MDKYIWVVETTVSSESHAKKLSTEAVQLGLAACAQIDSPVQSIFCWKGETESTLEYRVRLKLAEKTKTSLLSWLGSNHPYECPEILLSKVISVNPDYTNWVEQS